MCTTERDEVDANPSEAPVRRMSLRAAHIPDGSRSRCAGRSGMMNCWTAAGSGESLASVAFIRLGPLLHEAVSSHGMRVRRLREAKKSFNPAFHRPRHAE